MADTRYDIRPFEDADLPEVLELLRASLGESALLQRTPDLFAWKHIDNPFGRSLMLVATDDSAIIGFRAFMRWELRTPAGETLRCVRAVDTATHPDHQRRGIFANLTTAAVAAAAEDGVDLIFNTPNPRSGAGYLKMGWTEVGAIRPLAVPGRGLFRSSSGSDELPDPNDFVSDGAAVGERTIEDRDPVGLRTPRTAHYHRWRFQGHPTATYVQVDHAGGTSIARLAFRGSRRELLISDVYGSHMSRTVRHTHRIARTAYVGAYFSQGTPERSAVVRSGFVPVPTAKLTLMARPLHPLDVDVADLATWDLALSDLELL